MKPKKLVNPTVDLADQSSHSIVIIFFLSFNQTNREKKREREREELWKKLHELEISRTNRMLMNSSNSDTIQSPTNTTTSASSNPFSSTTTSTITKTNTTSASAAAASAAGSINPSADSTGDTYNLIKKESVLKED